MDQGLRGVRVAVTRPEEAATELVDGLRARGAVVSHHPLIRVAPPADTGAVAAAARQVGRYDWVVFTSVNAVRALTAALEAAGTALVAGRQRVAAVGAATAGALAEQGIAVHVCPDDYVGRALPEAMAQVESLDGARVLLPRSAIGGEELPVLLRARGAQVHDVAVYRTLADEPGARALAEALKAGALDIVTFTSPSAVRALAGVCRQLPPAVRVVAIGPSTAQAAARAGFPVNSVAEPHTAGGIVAAVARLGTVGE